VYRGEDDAVSGCDLILGVDYMACARQRRKERDYLNLETQGKFVKLIMAVFISFLSKTACYFCLKSLP